MKLNKKLLFLCLLLVTMVMLLTACGEADPYEVNNGLNYNVSIKFDANGGSFTSVNSPVLVDSYNITGLQKNAEGKVDLPLLKPDDANRGDDAKKAQKSGYFLVGWYQERTETTDANGNTVYTYAKPWDFETGRVSVDPAQKNTAKEPVLTLYAAWAPLFEIEYYAVGDSEAYKTVTFDPNAGTQITLPAWDLDSGAMNMNGIPAKEGYTFTAAYLDSEKTQPIDAAAVNHTGTINYENATVTGNTMKLYLDFKKGEWFKISDAQQFIKNYKPSGCYEILSDLDFSGKNWPTSLMFGNFTGTIQGNGYTISNISLKQTGSNRMNAGLFGSLAEGAYLCDITFDNVTFAVEDGTRLQGAAYGLLAGAISEKADVQNVFVTNSTLKIVAGANLSAVSIGLISGYGDAGLDSSGITCVAVNKDGTETVVVAQDGFVSVTFDTAGNLVTESAEDPKVDISTEETSQELPEEEQEIPQE